MKKFEYLNQPVSVREAAEFYTAHDISVVPLNNGKKILNMELVVSGNRDRIKNPLRKYLKEVASNKILDHWFASNECNIGVLGGYQRTVILDFDDKKSFEKWKADNPVIASNTAVQESLRGYHVFLRFKKHSISEYFWRMNFLYSNFLVPGFRYEDDTGQKIYPGQIVWSGSYVVVWPSHIDRTAFTYAWEKGSSPFDKPFYEIRSLKEAGVVSESILSTKFVPFLLDWFREPSKNIAYLYVIYNRILGRRDYVNFTTLRKNIAEGTRYSNDRQN